MNILKATKKICVMFLMSQVFLCQLCLAENYYIDATGGNDSNIGTTPTAAWKTIRRIKSIELFPGDSILLKRGEMWREELRINYSGTHERPITVGAYGAGHKPILNGADLHNTDNWTIDSTNIWVTDYSRENTIIVIDDILYLPVSSKELLIACKYYIDESNDKLYVYSTDDPDNHAVELSARHDGIFINTQQYINIDNIKCQYFYMHAFFLYGPQANGFCTISNCEAYCNRVHGITAYNGHSHNTIENCTSSYNGINLYTHKSNYNTFRNNVSHHAIRYRITGSYTDGTGFGNEESDYTMFEGNTVYKTDAANGVEIYYGEDVTFCRNLIYNNGHHGIVVDYASGTTNIYYNVVFNNGEVTYPESCYGILVWKNNSGNINIYNNVIYNDADHAHGFLWDSGRIDAKNNIVYIKNSLKSCIVIDGTATYTNDYNILYGNNVVNGSCGINSMSLDPLFVDHTNQEFHLQSTSPAINSGIDVGLTEDFWGNPIKGLPDIGAFEYQGGSSALPPSIQSVTINPSSGWVGIGDTVAITVRTVNNETGLDASLATINGSLIKLSDQGNGTYTGIYTVQSGDSNGVNIEATGITLTGEGGTSVSASSSGSTLRVDAQSPVISAIELVPSQGWLCNGDTVTVIVRTDPAETELTTSMANINSYTIPLEDNGDGTYRGIYTVQAGHPQGRNLAAQNIILTDTAGNSSLPASSSVSTLSVDTEAPVISSVTLSPDAGQVIPGDQVVVHVFTTPPEMGLNGTVEFNGKTILLEDISDGIYRGVYTVNVSDTPASNAQATNALLSDAAGNTSKSSNSPITDLRIVPNGSNDELPKISSVEISPDRGWVKTGDTVQIKVKAETPKSGMTASPASINGKIIPMEPLIIQSDAYHVTEVPGTFIGNYIVEVNDAQG